MARHIYKAASVLEEPDRPHVQPRPVVDGKPLEFGFRWIALSPWYYYESESEAKGVVDAAPATYRNGTPIDTECSQPWSDPEDVKGQRYFASIEKGKVRSITAERAVAESHKWFDARKQTVKSLEFWTNEPADTAKAAEPIKVIAVDDKVGLTALEAVAQNLKDVPIEKWFAAVAVYDDGSRQLVHLTEILRAH